MIRSAASIADRACGEISGAGSPARVASLASADRGGGVDDPAAARHQVRGGSLVQPGTGRDRDDARAPICQPGAGVQGITAVVAAASQDHDPRTVDPVQQAGACCR